MAATTTTPKSTIPKASCTFTLCCVWKRVRRKSFAPRRPAVFGEQWGLILVVGLAVALGAFAVILVITH